MMSSLMVPLFLIASFLVNQCNANVYQLNIDNFMEFIDGPHHKLVKFYAPWCGHCQEIAPHYLRASTSYATEESNLLFAEVDASVETTLADELAVTSFPSFFWFPEGNSDSFEQIALGQTLEQMYSTLNHRLDMKKRMPVPEVPHLVQHLNSTEDFNYLVATRGNRDVIVNIYGEGCPGSCLRMHMNLPRVALIYKQENIIFARLHGEDHYDVVSRFDALWYPSVVFFPKIEEGVELFNEKGDYTHLTYSDMDADPVKLIEWINEQTGYERDENGGLLPSAGNIPALDDIINKSTSITSPSLLAELQEAVASLPPHDESSRFPSMAAAYLRTAKKIQEGGELFVTSEMAYYAEEVKNQELEPSDRDDLYLAYNVLKVFSAKNVPAYHSTFESQSESMPSEEILDEL